MARSRLVMSMWLAALLTVAVAVTTWLTGALAAGPSSAVTWTTVAPQPFATLEGSGITVGGRFYAFGGYDVTKLPTYTPTGRSYVYDPGANQWTALATLPAFNGSGHAGITHAGIATDGASIYLAGGYPSNPAGDGQVFATTDVWRYDLSSNSYAPMPALPFARAAGGLAYVNGKLHFFGGVDASRAVEEPQHWALDLANLAAGWVARAPLPNPRNHLGTAVIGGRIYVVGGQHGQDEFSTSQASAEVYDSATDAWTELPPLPVALSHTVATDLGGQLVAVGGQTSYGVTSSSAYAYDPATNSWTAMSPLPEPRFAGMLGTVGGKLLFVGGSTSSAASNKVFAGSVPDLSGSGSALGQVAAGPGPAAGAASSFKVSARKTGVGPRIILAVTVPGAGSLTTRAISLKSRALIAPAKGTAKTAGPLKLVIKLTSAGKKQLRKKGRLTVKIKVSFNPIGGATTSRTISLTFKAKTKR